MKRRGGRLLTLGLAIAGLLIAPGVQAQDLQGLFPADHVAALRLPPQTSFEYSVSCSARNRRDGGRFHDAVVVAGDFRELPSWPRFAGFLHPIGDPHTSSGRSAEVEGVRLIDEMREDERFSFAGFSLGSNYLPPTVGANGDVLLAVATWGDEPECRLKFDGPWQDMPLEPDAVAFYAGPAAFAGGALLQDGRDQVVAARRFAADLPGGPTMARLNHGHVSSAKLALSGSDTMAWGFPCAMTGYRDGCYSEVGSAAASLVTAIIPAGTTLGGWDHGLYVVALPADGGG